jgi:hypothetical protein
MVISIPGVVLNAMKLNSLSPPTKYLQRLGVPTDASPAANTPSEIRACGSEPQRSHATSLARIDNCGPDEAPDAKDTFFMATHHVSKELDCVFSFLEYHSGGGLTAHKKLKEAIE